MKIISQRQHHEDVTYRLFFEDRENDGAGYSFTCDKEGNVQQDLLGEFGKANLAKCRENKDNRFFSPDVCEQINRWVEPAVGECPCGCSVSLDGFTNTCECGRDFNMSGQELAPRDQWGEETGESLSDILQIP